MKRRNDYEVSGRQVRLRRTTATTPRDDREVHRVSATRTPSCINEAAEKRRLRRRAEANKLQIGVYKVTELQQSTRSFRTSRTNSRSYGKEALKRRQERHQSAATRKSLDEYEDVQFRHRVRQARLKSQSMGKDEFKIPQRISEDKKTEPPNEGNEIAKVSQSSCLMSKTPNNVKEDDLDHEQKRNMTFALCETKAEPTIRLRARPRKTTKAHECFKLRPQRRKTTVKKTRIGRHGGVQLRPRRRRAMTKATKKKNDITLRPRRRKVTVNKSRGRDDFKLQPRMSQATAGGTRTDGKNDVLSPPQRLRAKVSKPATEVSDNLLQKRFREAKAETPIYVNKVVEQRQDSHQATVTNKPSCSNKYIDQRESSRIKMIKMPNDRNVKTNQRTFRVMSAPMESSANKDSESRKRKYQAISTKASCDVDDDTERERKRRATVTKSVNSQHYTRRVVSAQPLIDGTKRTDSQQRTRQSTITKRLTGGNDDVELRPCLRRTTTTKSISYDKTASGQRKSTQRVMAQKFPTYIKPSPRTRTDSRQRTRQSTTTKRMTGGNDDVELRPRLRRTTTTKTISYDKTSSGQRKSTQRVMAQKFPTYITPSPRTRTDSRQRTRQSTITKRLTGGNDDVELRPRLRRTTTTKTISYDKTASGRTQRVMAQKFPTYIKPSPRTRTDSRQRTRQLTTTKRLTGVNNDVELRPSLRRATTTKTISYDKAASGQRESKQRVMAQKFPTYIKPSPRTQGRVMVTKTPTNHKDDVKLRPQRWRERANHKEDVKLRPQRCRERSSNILVYECRAGERRKRRHRVTRN